MTFAGAYETVADAVLLPAPTRRPPLMVGAAVTDRPAAACSVSKHTVRLRTPAGRRFLSATLGTRDAEEDS